MSKDDNVQDQLDEFTAQRHKFYAMKTRLAEQLPFVRQRVKVEVPEQTGNRMAEAEAEQSFEVNLDDVSDLTREKRETSRLTAQGYTMHEEISHVALSQELSNLSLTITLRTDDKEE